MEKYVKLSTSKERITTAVFIVTVLLLLINYSTFYFDYPSSYWPIVKLCLLFIGIGIAVKIECSGWVSILWNTLLIVLAVTLSSTIINTLMPTVGSPKNESGFFRIQETALSLLICLFVYLAFLLLTARPRLAIILGSIFWFLFSITAYYVYAFRGELFLFSDIFAAPTAMDVAENYQLELTAGILLSILLLIAGIVFSLNASLKIKSYKKGILIRTVSLGACACMVISFWTTNSEKFYYSFNAIENEYLYSFAVSAKMLYPLPPDGYNPDNLENYIDNDTVYVANSDNSNLPTQTEISDVKPNIIAIMNESFADLSVLGDFETNVDYMPFIHSLEENTIKGNTYVSVFGGGTCDSEYSFLTGNTTAYLPANARPYQQYIKDDIPSIVSTLEAQGYISEAIHPGTADAWNRNNVYTAMGFNQFIDRSQFIDPVYTRSSWISDQSCYDRIISDYENSNQLTDQPQFYFNVTIANHGGYDIPADDLESVTITGHEGEFPKAEQYLSLILESDRAFEELVNYFSNQEEPTIILFFGDHQVQLDDTFYEFIKGNSLSDWTIEEIQQRQITPFIIWANYDIPNLTIDKLSVNYLVPLLLKTAGLEMTAYDNYLLNLSKDLPVIDSLGIIDKDSHCYKKGESTLYDNKLSEYQQLLYNNIIDTKHRQTDLYTLPDTSS